MPWPPASKCSIRRVRFSRMTDWRTTPATSVCSTTSSSETHIASSPISAMARSLSGRLWKTPMSTIVDSVLSSTPRGGSPCQARPTAAVASDLDTPTSGRRFMNAVPRVSLMRMPNALRPAMQSHSGSTAGAGTSVALASSSTLAPWVEPAFGVAGSLRPTRESDAGGLSPPESPLPQSRRELAMRCAPRDSSPAAAPASPAAPGADDGAPERALS
mmetsp:Transcript_18754/g.66239  ORF Transcript_18754/g.66239 Transcript_18754/m.66239 type:complete len:216 (-) Transcript_18754:285-932(-)